MMHLQGAINDTFYTWLDPATGSVLLQLNAKLFFWCRVNLEDATVPKITQCNTYVYIYTCIHAR